MSTNPLCKMLNIRYPIIQAGMSGSTTPELVGAVSNAGGLGIVGAARLTPDQLLDMILKIKKLTTRPYGVNLLLATPRGDDNRRKYSYSGSAVLGYQFPPEYWT